MLQPTVPAMTNDLAPDHLRGRYNALVVGRLPDGRHRRAGRRGVPAAPRPAARLHRAAAGRLRVDVLARAGARAPDPCRRPTASPSRRSRPSRCSSGRTPRSTTPDGHRTTSHEAAARRVRRRRTPQTSPTRTPGRAAASHVEEARGRRTCRPRPAPARRSSTARRRGTPTVTEEHRARRPRRPAAGPGLRR